MARAHFTQASDAARARIRAAGEARGFQVTRLLTHWAEIAGEATAAIARPMGVRLLRSTRPRPVHEPSRWVP